MMNKSSPKRISVLLLIASLPWLSSGGIIPADRMAAWNPGILIDGQLGRPLTVDGIPQRTTVYTTIGASTYGNGSQDASRGIQTAVDACPAGQVVQLSEGVFKITSTINITKGVVLRGMGPTKTKLKMPIGQSSNGGLILVGTLWYKFIQSTGLAANAAKGSNSLTLSKSLGLTAGELVCVDKVTDASLSKWGYTNCQNADDPCRTWFTRPNRPLGQILEVASVSGTTVTFTTPFHIDFTIADSAQLSRFSDQINGQPHASTKYAGVEDLYLSGGSQGKGNISIENGAYCWIKNIESDSSEGASVFFESTFRCVLRDSYIHSTQNPTPGGGGYGLSVGVYSADNLFENNILWNFNKVMVCRSSGGGNVFGYNYAEDGWIGYDPSWVEVGLNSSHMTTPHYELFEGNESFNFDGDNTWGNAIYITVFRNHLTGKRRSLPPLQLTDGGNPRAIGLMEGHWWYSFIGNVLGYEGMAAASAGGFVYEAPGPNNSVPMWNLGYNPENWNNPPDPKVRSTAIRHGNYDYVTQTQKWDTTIADHTIPNSLYLTSKPGFFGNCTWPWVQPDGSTKTYYLPARARFDSIHFDSVCPCLNSPASAPLTRSGNEPGFMIMSKPLSSQTTFEYNLPGIAIVHLDILNIHGQKVHTLVNGRETAGAHSVVWNTKGAAPGIYLCKLRAYDRSYIKRIVLK